MTDPSLWFWMAIFWGLIAAAVALVALWVCVLLERR